MACMPAANIDAYGDWVQKAVQNPPNANQANRNQAQKSAVVALRGAAATHCAQGNANCNNGICALDTIWDWRYSFEDGTFNNIHYIRCHAKAWIDCDCKQGQQGQGNGNNGEGNGNGNGNGNQQTPDPDLPPNPTVASKKSRKK